MKLTSLATKHLISFTFFPVDLQKSDSQSSLSSDPEDDPDVLSSSVRSDDDRDLENFDAVISALTFFSLFLQYSIK